MSARLGRSWAIGPEPEGGHAVVQVLEHWRVRLAGRIATHGAATVAATTAGDRARYFTVRVPTKVTDGPDGAG